MTFWSWAERTKASRLKAMGCGPCDSSADFYVIRNSQSRSGFVVGVDNNNGGPIVVVRHSKKGMGVSKYVWHWLSHMGVYR